MKPYEIYTGIIRNLEIRILRHGVQGLGDFQGHTA